MSKSFDINSLFARRIDKVPDYVAKIYCFYINLKSTIVSDKSLMLTGIETN